MKEHEQQYWYGARAKREHEGLPQAPDINDAKERIKKRKAMAAVTQNLNYSSLSSGRHHRKSHE